MMTTEPHQHADDSIHGGANSPITILKLGEDFKWMLPVILIVGINLAATVFMVFAWRDSAMYGALMYSRAVKIDGDLDRLGIDTKRYGPIPTPP